VQRQCACGGNTASGHECQQCREKRKAAQRHVMRASRMPVQRQAGTPGAANAGVLASVGGGEWWEWYCALLCAICVGTIIAPELMLPEAACAICMDADLCAKG
jgi:hypothetical protein